MPLIRDLIAALGRLAPWDLAEEWDNSGLQFGHPGAEVHRVAVALDPGAAEVAWAAASGAQALVTHHPLFFGPLRRLSLDVEPGSLVGELARAGVAVVSAHTNLDSAPGGLGDQVARKLGLDQVEPLVPAGRGGYAKLVVFAPEGSVEPLKKALEKAGAGRIGRYAGCFFEAPGQGSFRPLEGARPAVGRVGRQEKVAETRLEARVPARALAEALAAVRSAHPYEEPAVDAYAVIGPEEGAGIGRLGRCSLAPDELLDRVRTALACRTLRTSGPRPPRVERVALVPGSGGDCLPSAAAAGAQAFVTGELRYHQAREAASLGLWVVEAGHDVSEAPAVPLMAAHLREESRVLGWGLEVMEKQPAQGFYGYNP